MPEAGASPNPAWSDIPFVLDDMTIADVPTVSLVERRVYPSPWSANAFRYEVQENKSASYYVLRYLPWRPPEQTTLTIKLRRLLGSGPEDVSLIGYGGYWQVLDEVHVTNVALREGWRGQGLGELLLLGLIEHAVQDGASFVTLEVRASNAVAQSLYKKYGFRQVGLRKGYYTDNREDALLLTASRVATATYAAKITRLRDDLVAKLRENPPVPPALNPA